MNGLRCYGVAALSKMPPILISNDELAPFSAKWLELGGRLARTPPASSLDFGNIFDLKVGQSLATFLGGIRIVVPSSTALTPSVPDCVEVGPVRVVGGVRPQNFDVGYRPDGVRVAFDSKTLNDKKSVAKNYQNMINDLATEATTVHTRFPYAVVAFMVVIPGPCLAPTQLAGLIGTLERLGGRSLVDEPLHRAEVLSFVVWDPETSSLSTTLPVPDSPLRVERFSATLEAIYRERYKGLPPHAEAPLEPAGPGDE